MGKALTMDSTVSCGHDPPGFVMPQSTAKLAVGGKPVLVQSSIKTIGPGCTPKAQGDKACTTVAGITAGQSVKLFTGSSPAGTSATHWPAAAEQSSAVMLDDSLAATTDGIIGGLKGALTVVKVQAKLVAL